MTTITNMLDIKKREWLELDGYWQMVLNQIIVEKDFLKEIGPKTCNIV